jgi:hypothetical protein
VSRVGPLETRLLALNPSSRLEQGDARRILEMLYVGIAFLVLFLLLCFGLCSQTKNADEMMMLAYKEMMEERARKEGVQAFAAEVPEVDAEFVYRI